jgi:hypothetical protein
MGCHLYAQPNPDPKPHYIGYHLYMLILALVLSFNNMHRHLYILRARPPHRSVYYFVTASEERLDICALDEEVDLFEAWETAISDWRGDTEEIAVMYGTRSLHLYVRAASNTRPTQLRPFASRPAWRHARLAP